MNTSKVELSNVSAHGLWLLIDEREVYLPFDEFPWFRNATIAQLARIDSPAPDHLRWPDLDVDLSLASIEHPDRYPLVSGAGARVRETEENDDVGPEGEI
ncbi:MAG: DUF2442 domain-containing protein [Gemmatimonadetes bacterium]|nr:DUF2442 domain-containing protein [Gemmatimonadota bacterium]